MRLSLICSILVILSSPLYAEPNTSISNNWIKDASSQIDRSLTGQFDDLVQGAYASAYNIEQNVERTLSDPTSTPKERRDARSRMDYVAKTRVFAKRVQSEISHSQEMRQQIQRQLNELHRSKSDQRTQALKISEIDIFLNNKKQAVNDEGSKLNSELKQNEQAGMAIRHRLQQGNVSSSNYRSLLLRLDQLASDKSRIESETLKNKSQFHVLSDFTRALERAIAQTRNKPNKTRGWIGRLSTLRRPTANEESQRPSRQHRRKRHIRKTK